MLLGVDQKTGSRPNILNLSERWNSSLSFLCLSFITITNRNRLTDLENKHMFSREGRMGKEIVRKLGINTSTLLYLKWKTSKILLYGTWNSAQCYVQPEWGGSLGENEYMYMYGWTPLLTTGSYHIIGNQLHSSIKSKVFKKEFALRLLSFCPAFCNSSKQRQPDK